MTAERDAFGFYFSAHPVDSQRHLLAAHKVKSFAELSSIRAPADGGRSPDDDGGDGRKRPLAHLGQGPPLHDGDDLRPVGPI